MMEGCNSGWCFMINSDPKQVTKKFITDCATDQAEADELKQKIIDNWKSIKNPIYALCRFNLMEIVIKYISNIILFVIIVVIEFNREFFIAWFIVICLCIIIFIITFWFWLEIIWEYPIIDKDDAVVIYNESVAQQLLPSSKSSTNKQGIFDGRRHSGWKE